MASLSKPMVPAMTVRRTASTRQFAPLGEAPPTSPGQADEQDAVEAAMHALLVSAQPQSSSEALWILRQHYPPGAKARLLAELGRDFTGMTTATIIQQLALA